MYLDLQAASRHGKGSNRVEEFHNHRVRDRTGAVCELRASYGQELYSR